MRIPRLLIALPLILVACTGPASGGDGSTVELRLGYFPNVTHATAIVGVENGIFQDKLGSGVTLDHPDLQRRRRRGGGDLRRRAGRQLRRAESGHQCLGSVRGHRHQDHLRRHLGRRLPGGQPRHHQPRPAGRQEAGQPAAGQHPGRGAACLAQGAGLRDRPGGRRRRLDPAAGQRRHPDRLQHRRPGRRLGAGAMGHAHDRGGRRPRPGRRARPVAGRRVRHHAPDRGHRVPRRAPGRRQAAARGPGGRQRVRQRQPGRGAAGGRRPPSAS